MVWCGRVLGCRYCHVYIATEFYDKLDDIENNERSQLEDLETGRRTNSRMSCQVLLSPDLDGLVVALPEPDDPAVF